MGLERGYSALKALKTEPPCTPIPEKGGYGLTVLPCDVAGPRAQRHWTPDFGVAKAMGLRCGGLQRAVPCGFGDRAERERARGGAGGTRSVGEHWPAASETLIGRSPQ